MAGTVADNMHAALGLTSPKTNIDLLNASLNYDIQKYGFGYAIIKNWGQGNDTVVEAMRRHYGALPGESLSDAQNRYWAQQASLYPPRTNISTDPQGLRNDAVVSGTGPHWLNNRFAADEAYSSLTGIVGPQANLTTAQRITWTTVNGTSRGWHFSGNPSSGVNSHFLWPVTPGSVVSISAWFKGTWASSTPSGWFQTIFFDASNNPFGGFVTSAITPLTSTVWKKQSLTVTVPANAAWFAAAYILQGGTVTIGDTLDGTGLLCENNAPANAIGGGIAPYFDGSMPNAVWTGTVGASTSTTANGQAGYTQTITNLVRDPTAKTVAAYWTVTSGNYALTLDSTTARPGALTTDSAKCLSGAAPASFSLLTGVPYAIPCTPGQQFTVSAYVKTDAAGQNCRVNNRWRDPTNTSLILNSLAPAVTNLTANTWVRINFTDVCPAGAGYLEPGVIFSGIPTGNAAWLDDMICTADGFLWDYKDGGYPGWSWSGVANQSISSGTTIT